MRKSLLAIILSLPVFSVCADLETQDDTDGVKIPFAGRNVSLVNDKGHCALTSADNWMVRLDVKWPCQFSKNHQGKVLLENYRSAQIFMVQHSEPSVSQDRRCDTDLQAVRYFKGVIELAPVSRVGACTTRRWDQKVFVWQFDW